MTEPHTAPNGAPCGCPARCRAALLGLSVLAALPLSACGATRSRRAPTQAEFAASAEAVCGLQQVKLSYVRQRAGALVRLAVAPVLLRKEVAIAQAATARLEALAKPTGDASGIGRWLTARTVAATVAADLAEAPPGHESTAVRDVIGELASARARARELARAYGPEVCVAVE